MFVVLHHLLQEFGLWLAPGACSRGCRRVGRRIDLRVRVDLGFQLGQIGSPGFLKQVALSRRERVRSSTEAHAPMMRQVDGNCQNLTIRGMRLRV